MRRCHKCGEGIPDNENVVRSLRTGTYSGGGAYFRDVNLCSRCDTEHSRLERVRFNQIAWGVLLAIVAVIGGGVYTVFFRHP